VGEGGSCYQHSIARARGRNSASLLLQARLVVIGKSGKPPA
jgi:hypothetical protein